MIEEQYISFDNAKLAKEKGFDESVRKYFTPKGDNTFINFFYLPTKYLHGIARPTQSLLARWLREKHNMCVEVYSTAYGFEWCICDIDSGNDRCDSDEKSPNNGGIWDTYEEAMEDGLQEALKLIESEETK